MTHIFISYSTKNRDYAIKLETKLREEGFDIWIDKRGLESSADWWRSIVLAIRNCAAVVTILTPESDTSEWVQREITLALKYNKKIFPLWLDGSLDTPNWEIFVRTQIQDVRDQNFPPESFYANLAHYTPRKQHPGWDVTTTQTVSAISIDDTEIALELANPPLPTDMMRARSFSLRNYIKAIIHTIHNNLTILTEKLYNVIEYKNITINRVPDDKTRNKNNIYIDNEISSTFPTSTGDSSQNLLTEKAENLSNLMQFTPIEIFTALSTPFDRSFSKQDWFTAREYLTLLKQLEEELRFFNDYFGKQVEKEIEREQAERKRYEQQLIAAKNRYENIKKIVALDQSSAVSGLLQEFWKVHIGYDPDGLAEKFHLETINFEDNSLGHIFLSYSHVDANIMLRLSNDLRAKGLQLWTDEALEPGTTEWESEIQKAIEVSNGLIVILSPNAKPSRWVNRELGYADEHKKRIFPVLVEGNIQNAVPIRLIGTQLVNLKENNYEKGLNLLFNTLYAHLNTK